MKKWVANFLVSLVILLNGYGNMFAQQIQFGSEKFHIAFHSNQNLNQSNYLEKGHSFETFRRKGCLVDNEENEENFSSIQKQLVKSNYFLNFLSHNKFTVCTTAITKKVNSCKIFNLLSNKVYLLLQVFRI